MGRPKETTMTTTTTYLPEGMPKPQPSPDGLDAPYWEGARRHELMVQCCNACGTYQWGPEWICYACHSYDVAWKAVEPKGRIYSWERVWHPVHPALRTACPYVVVLVELPGAGNVRMVGNLLGDPLQPVVIGGDVEAVFEDHDGYTLIQWQAV
jgi:uncharacterized OB-fold protein